MAGVAALLVVGFAALAMRESSGPMGYLFTELDPTSAQSIAEKLAGQGVPYQLSPDGTAILAPSDKLASLRMTLAADRVAGKIGYEVLDAEAPFGLSAAREKIDQTRAIEGELSKSIESLERVSKARVHVVMPDRPLFATEARPATASVQLRTQGRLGSSQVEAVRYLVASAVPDLAPERISVIDQTGALLARAGDPADGGAGASDERRTALQNQLRGNVEMLLERAVGPGLVRAEVAVDLDPDQIREEQEIFDPDGQVVAKTTSVENTDNSDETNGILGGAASVSSQLPENKQPNIGGEARKSQANQRSEETSYDNSKTDRTRIRPAGAIRKLSVSVMVDGIRDGDKWKPRTPAEIQRLQRLVETAVGFDAARGDRITVDSMKFSTPTDLNDAADWSLPTGELFSLARVLLMGGLLLAGIWMITRLLRDRLANAPPAVSAEPIQLTGMPVPTQQSVAALEQAVDAERESGNLRATIVRKAGELASDNAAEAATLVRQWMTA